MFMITVCKSLMVNTADAAHYGVQCQAVVYSWFYFSVVKIPGIYEGWNFNSGNYLFTTDTK